jgi:toxin ParE1/3/4
MSPRAYELSAAARLDLMRIWNYLAENASVDIADNVLTDIEAAIKKLAKHPGLGHARSDLTVQELLFYPVHSYFLIYRPDSKPLQIARVLHSAQDVKRMLEE